MTNKYYDGKAMATNKGALENFSPGQSNSLKGLHISPNAGQGMNQKPNVSPSQLLNDSTINLCNGQQIVKAADGRLYIV